MQTPPTKAVERSFDRIDVARSRLAEVQARLHDLGGRLSAFASSTVVRTPPATPPVPEPEPPRPPAAAPPPPTSQTPPVRSRTARRRRRRLVLAATVTPAVVVAVVVAVALALPGSGGERVRATAASPRGRTAPPAGAAGTPVRSSVTAQATVDVVDVYDRPGGSRIESLPSPDAAGAVLGFPVEVVRDDGWVLVHLPGPADDRGWVRIEQVRLLDTPGSAPARPAGDTPEGSRPS